MKNLILAMLLLFISAQAHAAFNEQKDAIGKSSYTETADTNVQLSSSPSFVRYVSLSGVETTTITFYNTKLFTVNTTTRAKVYWPGGQTVPTTIWLGIINSSGTMYQKVGNGEAVFNWDWTSRPDFKDPLNDKN